MHVPVSISARGHNSKLRNHGIATARVRKNLACENHFSHLRTEHYRVLIMLLCRISLCLPQQTVHRNGTSHTGTVTQVRFLFDELIVSYWVDSHNRKEG